MNKPVTKLYALTDDMVIGLNGAAADMAFATQYDSARKNLGDAIIALAKPVDVHTVDIRGGGYAKFIEAQGSQITALREQLTRRDEQIAAMIEVERLRLKVHGNCLGGDGKAYARWMEARDAVFKGCCDGE